MLPLGTGPRLAGQADRNLGTILTGLTRLSFKKHAKTTWEGGGGIENDIVNRYDISNRSRNIDVNVLLNL